MSSLPKPVLRGHIRKSGYSIIIGALCFGTVNALLYRFLVALPRQAKYEEFVRNYDIEKHFQEMSRYGLLSSVKEVRDKQ